MAGKRAEGAAGKTIKRRRGRPKKEGDTTSTTIRLPDWLREELAKQAEDEDRTQTAIIRRALEAYLAERAGRMESEPEDKGEAG